ncbi:MAG TPA: response regulator [Ginsengibacter sp.]|nr:response regulator [Ginsengibacter sp.]
MSPKNANEFMSKLLIVDDSTDLLEAMELILLQKGYEVKTLPEYDSIYKEINNFNPDLLILDIFLAGRDGRDICEELRKTIADKYLCIIMFSASAKALENYKSYGADDYLEKPFGINNLVEKIESVLEACKDK